MTIQDLAPDATDLPFEDGDPRGFFARAVAIATDTIACVRPEQLGDPTPCVEFDVRGLLGHLVEGLEYVATIGRGEPAGAAGGAVVLADDSWVAAWLDAARTVHDVWADDAVLARTVHLPWLTTTGGVALLGFTSEVTVHCWDLATATGQQPAWDQAVLEVADESLRAVLGREGRDDPSVPFGPVIAVPDGAPLIDRLVAWAGRRPDA